MSKYGKARCNACNNLRVLNADGRIGTHFRGRFDDGIERRCDGSLNIPTSIEQPPIKTWRPQMTTSRDLLRRAHAALRGESCRWCGAVGDVLGDTKHREKCARGELVRELAEAIKQKEVTHAGTQ